MDKSERAAEIKRIVESRGLFWNIYILDRMVSAGIRIRPDSRTIVYAAVEGDSVSDAIIEAARKLFGVKNE